MLLILKSWCDFQNQNNADVWAFVIYAEYLWYQTGSKEWEKLLTVSIVCIYFIYSTKCILRARLYSAAEELQKWF